MIRIKNSSISLPVQILLVLTVGCLFFFGGCYGLGKFIYKSRGCGPFYIDNMEMHTRTNIPDKKEIECAYNSKTKLKSVYYVIDKERESIPDYISWCEFIRLSSDRAFKTEDFLRFNTDTLKKLHSEALFYKEYTKQNGEYYKGLLDTVTGQVWLNLEYE